MKKPVEFGRGVETGYEEKTYTSKCGNFKIVSHKFNLPVASVGYKVSKMVNGEWVRVGPVGKYSDSLWGKTADSLSEAKLWACFEIDPNYEG